MSRHFDLALVGAAASGPSDQQPVGTHFIALLAAGLLVLAAWGIIRALRPKKLLLRHVPGRPNRAPVAVVVLVYAAYLLALAAMQHAAARLAGVPPAKLPMEYALPVVIVGQALLAGMSLLLAAWAFRHGLVRGLGLSLRRWPWDLGRGVIGLLAILPLCFATVQGTRWLIQIGWLPLEIHEHPVLVFLPSASRAWLIVVMISTVVLAPLVEEVFFRGLLQSSLKRYLPHPWAAVLLASAAFAIAHGEQYQDMPALFVLGIALGYNYERTGRLLAPVLLHGLFNAVMLWTALGG